MKIDFDVLITRTPAMPTSLFFGCAINPSAQEGFANLFDGVQSERRNPAQHLSDGTALSEAREPDGSEDFGVATSLLWH